MFRARLIVIFYDGKVAGLGRKRKNFITEFRFFDRKSMFLDDGLTLGIQLFKYECRQEHSV